MLPGDLCIQPATAAPCSLPAAWLGLSCQPVSCLALLHWASLLAMTRCCLPWSSGRDSGQSRILMHEGVGVLSVGSASASLAEDEGLLHLSPEAYISPTDSHFGRTGKAVEKGLTEESAWEEALMG